MKKLGLAGALVLLGCGGSDGGTDPKPNPPQGELTASLTGPTQRSGQAGTLLTEDLVVQVRRGGQPASGVTVQFAVPGADCGSPTSASVATGQDGTARTKWQLGTKAGNCTLEVRTVESSGATPVQRGTFTATIAPAAADTVGLWVPFVLLNVEQITVPLGDSVRLASLVRRATDRYGNQITSPDVQATVTTGTAAVRGGFLVATAAQGAGQLKVTVGNTSHNVRFAAVRDLGEHRWETNLLCRHVGHLKVGDVRMDSVLYDLVSDSVTYYSPGDPRLLQLDGRGPVASLYFSGRQRTWLADGRVDTTVVSDWRREIILQRNDSMRVVPGLMEVRFSSSPSSGLSLKSNDSPPTFTGGTFCPDSTGLRNSPKMVLRAQ